MTGWQSLHVDLRRLFEESPGALVVGPNPDSEPPIRIQLAAWATDIAAMLNARYGSLLDLEVGAMTFPARQLWLSEDLTRRSYHRLTGVSASRADLARPGKQPRTH